MAVKLGTQLNDLLNGSDDNDMFAGLGGDDTLNGGLGNDTAWYSGNLSGYAFSSVGGRLVVRDTNAADGSDGTDNLGQIETLQFGNGQLQITGTEFLVNTYTTNWQSNPSITALADGGFVVSWGAYVRGDGSSLGIYAQRYNSDGQAVGTEFLVNNYTTNWQGNPSITALADGGFVVIWESQRELFVPEGVGLPSYTDIYAQSYNAGGQAVGSEFRVNTYTTIDQKYSSITALADGGFIVSWSSHVQDGSEYGIYAQRYDVGGQAVGAEFQVNTSTTGNQVGSSITALADGGFVVSWKSDPQDGSDSGICAQRYDVGGQTVGAEFQVKSYTNITPGFPSITALKDGGFVVVWTASDGFESGGICAQRYDADGQTVGTEFQVNTYTLSSQGNPSITALADGGFIVSWESYGQDGSEYGIYAQRYDADGQSVGSEFLVNKHTANYQWKSSITALADGGFVVSWHSYNPWNGDDLNGIYARRFDANGNPVDLWMRLTGGTGADIINLDPGQLLTVDGAGGNDTINGSGGDDVLLGGAGNDSLTGNAGNDYLDGGAGNDRMAGGLGDDDYYVDSVGDVLTETTGAGNDSVFSSVNWMLTANFENLTLTGIGSINGTGNAQGNLLSGNSGNNILDGKAGVDTLAGGIGNDTYVVDNILDVIRESTVSGTDLVQTSVTYSLGDNLENLTLTGSAAINGYGNELANFITGNNGVNLLKGEAGNDTLSGLAGNDWLFGGLGADTLTGGLGVDTFRFDTAFSADNADLVTDFVHGTDKISILPALVGATGSHGALSASEFIATAGLLAGDTHRIIYDTNTGGLYYNADGANNGGEALIATFQSKPPLSASDIFLSAGTSGDDTLNGGPGMDTAWYSGNMAGYAFHSVGGRLVVRDTNAVDGSDGTDNLGQIETLQFGNGQLSLTPEFRVNSYTTGSQYDPTVTSLTDGGFVISWVSFGQDGSEWGVYGQRFDANGAASGAEFQINSYTTDTQNYPSITALTDGGFVVSWWSAGQDGFGHGIYAQRYDAAGVASGAEFRVNSYTTYDQSAPTITALADGGFVVSWLSGGQDSDGQGIYAQRYDAAGVASGAEFRVNSYTTNDQRNPTIVALTDGGFVVSWESAGQDSDGQGIYAQRYDAAGVVSGAEFQVNSYTTNDQRNPAIVALTDGGFVVSWQSAGQDGSGQGIYAQRYDAAGVASGPEFQVNSYTTSDQSSPTIAALADGGFVVSWTDIDGNGQAIYAQRYDAAGVASGPEFRVNSYTTNDQRNPTIAALTDGGFVVSWLSGDQDGSSFGIYAQRYDANGDPVGLKLTGGAGTDTINLDPGQLMTVDGAGGNDILNGSIGDDLLLGGLGNDNLTGNAGNDYLDGGAGNDRMAGGLGDDDYYVDSRTDLPTEAAGAGNDSVFSSVNWTLAANFENLFLTGIGNINGTGNVQGNLLSGNSGNNILDGKAGADLMAGGFGDDTYIVDNVYDIVSEDTDAGIDLIRTSVSFYLSAHIENLLMNGSSALAASGNGLDNSMIGNSGSNILQGFDGNDTLSGQGGADTLTGGNGSDRLVGGIGNDMLTGGAGADLFVFDTALSASSNKDTITDFIHGEDTISLDRDIFSKLAIGNLGAANFLSNATGKAADANEYIVYNTATGALLYDADGSGSGAAVQFATLITMPTIDAGDFLVTV